MSTMTTPAPSTRSTTTSAFSFTLQPPPATLLAPPCFPLPIPRPAHNRTATPHAKAYHPYSPHLPLPQSTNSHLLPTPCKQLMRAATYLPRVPPSSQLSRSPHQPAPYSAHHLRSFPASSWQVSHPERLPLHRAQRRSPPASGRFIPRGAAAALPSIAAATSGGLQTLRELIPPVG